MEEQEDEIKALNEMILQVKLNYNSSLLASLVFLLRRRMGSEQELKPSPLPSRLRFTPSETPNWLRSRRLRKSRRRRSGAWMKPWKSIASELFESKKASKSGSDGCGRTVPWRSEIR